MGKREANSADLRIFTDRGFPISSFEFRFSGIFPAAWNFTGREKP